MDEKETQLKLEEIKWKLPTEKDLKWKMLAWGRGDMINSPIVRNGWTISRLKKSDIPSIPKEGIERVEQILNSGVNVKGICIAHDRVEEEVVKQTPTTVNQPTEFPLAEIGMIVGGLLLFPLIAVAAVLCQGDPVLIAVIDWEDGKKPRWYEVWRWYE